jgi:hypothetical protein
MPVVNRATMQPRLRALHEVWHKWRGTANVPMFTRLNAEVIKPWLPNVAIVAVKADSNYVYRYYGQSFVEAFSVDMTGLDLMALPDAQRDILWHEYEYVRTRGRPTWRLYSGDFDGTIVTYERLILPFTKESRNVDALLIAAYEVTNEGVFEIS